MLFACFLSHQHIIMYTIDIMYIIDIMGVNQEVIEMLAMNATDARREFSMVVDRAVREKPQFIKRTRDQLILSDVRFIDELLRMYEFTADRYIEDDGSITLSLNEIDLVENAPTEAECLKHLAESILDYAKDYHDKYSFWSMAPNRKAHIPYVYKALILGNAERVGASIKCRDGQN